MTVAGVDDRWGGEGRHGDGAELGFARLYAHLLLRAVERAQAPSRAEVERVELGVPLVHECDLLLRLQALQLEARNQVQVLPRLLRELDSPGVGGHGLHRGAAELGLVHEVVHEAVGEVGPPDAGRRGPVLELARQVVVVDLRLQVLLGHVLQVREGLRRTATSVSVAGDDEHGHEDQGTDALEHGPSLGSCTENADGHRQQTAYMIIYSYNFVNI